MLGNDRFPAAGVVVVLPCDVLVGVDEVLMGVDRSPIDYAEAAAAELDRHDVVEPAPMTSGSEKDALMSPVASDNMNFIVTLAGISHTQRRLVSVEPVKSCSRVNPTFWRLVTTALMVSGKNIINRTSCRAPFRHSN